MAFNHVSEVYLSGHYGHPGEVLDTAFENLNILIRAVNNIHMEMEKMELRMEVWKSNINQIIDAIPFKPVLDIDEGYEKS